jgi:hypothetical protein
MMKRPSPVTSQFAMLTFGPKSYSSAKRTAGFPKSGSAPETSMGTTTTRWRLR